MTPQEQRNKRFDEKFDYIDGNNAFGELEHVKDFLTSEVNLTIEQVEKWAGEQRPLINGVGRVEYIKKSDLLTFLKELKK